MKVRGKKGVWEREKEGGREIMCESKMEMELTHVDRDCRSSFGELSH